MIPPARASTPSRWRRFLLWGAAVVAFLVASAYAVGGRDALRQLLRRGRDLRSQAVATLQPPTPSELQRITPDTPSVAAQVDAGQPASLALVLAWIGGILMVAIVMFYVTGRAPRKRRRD